MFKFYKKKNELKRKWLQVFKKISMSKRADITIFLT